MKQLVLIDAANAIYRAFFALPPLRTATGEPTGAVLGFANMLRRVLREQQPDFVAVVMDPPGEVFRQRLYRAYKANREAQPEDLSAQFPVLRELVEAWRIPILEAPDFEADDVIATLVSRAPEDMKVVVVSTDKDLMQLVSERVVLLDTMKEQHIGPAEVEQRFGVPPAQLLDLRALVGDPSDNIPGVKGIGEKGAAKLIQTWGTLDALLENVGKLTARRPREALEAHADEARLSKQLATLRLDAPVAARPDELVIREPDNEKLHALYKRLGFRRLCEELESGGAATAQTPQPGIAVEVVRNKKALEKSARELEKARRIALVLVGDPEAGGLVPEPVGIALCSDAQAKRRRASYWSLGHDEGLTITTTTARSTLDFETALPVLRDLLTGSEAKPWIARNSKRVQTLFAEHGSPLPLPAFDIELAMFLVDPAGKRDTSALASQWLGIEHGSWQKIAGRGAAARAARELSAEEVSAWAGAEACVLLGLEPRLRERQQSDGSAALFEQVELPLTAVLSKMERSGVRVDEALLAELSREYTRALSRLEGRIHKLAGEAFKINSPKQLQQILFDKLKLDPIKKTKTGYSTDEGVLEQLSSHHALPGEVLAWRRLAKLKSTYVDALPPLVNPQSGRIHPTFNQAGAATGRLSSQHPNVQNIPIRTAEGARIREAFIPAEGKLLLSADYSQVELRMMAHYSGDKSLIEAFARGEDVHRRTAAEVQGVAPDEVSEDQRAAAKAINFGIIYGSSAFGIANQLGIPQAEAQKLITRYFERYQGVRRFLDETSAGARESGFVQTLLGRRRYLPELASRNRTLRQAAERMATNTVIQGSAADLIKKAMVEVQAALQEAPFETQLILQVHDELVFEVAPEHADALAALVRAQMEQVVELAVPLVVDVGTGPNWRVAH